MPTPATSAGCRPRNSEGASFCRRYPITDFRKSVDQDCRSQVLEEEDDGNGTMPASQEDDDEMSQTIIA